jgi:hypothetical protein
MKIKLFLSLLLLPCYANADVFICTEKLFDIELHEKNGKDDAFIVFRNEKIPAKNYRSGIIISWMYGRFNNIIDLHPTGKAYGRKYVGSNNNVVEVPHLELNCERKSE